ncbi:MAG: hypothetical protein ACREAE_04385 [Nitrosopumilaceae archaeon]
MKASRVKYIGIRYSLVPLVVGMMLGACDYQGEPAPASGIIKETMTIEYDYIQNFDAGRDGRAFPEIRDNVKRAYMDKEQTFSHTAMIPILCRSLLLAIQTPNFQITMAYVWRIILKTIGMRSMVHL